MEVRLRGGHGCILCIHVDTNIKRNEMHFALYVWISFWMVWPKGASFLWTIFKTWQNVNFKKIKWIKKITSMQTMIKGRWARISLWLEAPVILSVNFETKLSPPFKQKNKYLISLNCDKHILKNNHKSAKILNVSFIVYKYIGICSIVWMTDIPVLVVQGGPFKTW